MKYLKEYEVKGMEVRNAIKKNKHNLFMDNHRIPAGTSGDYELFHADRMVRLFHLQGTGQRNGGRYSNSCDDQSDAYVLFP